MPSGLMQLPGLVKAPQSCDCRRSSSHRPYAGGELRKLSGLAALRGLILALGAMLLAAPAAHATPTFLSPVDVSAAGQDAYEPQVVVDPSGNSLMVWTRWDGSNLRIQARSRAADGTSGPVASISTAGRDAFEPQVALDGAGNAIAVWTQYDGARSRTHAAFRPAGGSFGGDQTISSGGQDAIAPQISLDPAGNAVAVWYRFDGATDRIQAAVRPANGSFGGVQSISPLGQESYEPMVAAGPNVDSNAVAVWTGLDGANTRIQSARRRDVVGFPRSKGASPTSASLVPASDQCTSGNRTHGSPLSFSSCAPPQLSSGVLTIGSPDANGVGVNFTGSVKFTTVAGDSATAADEADVRVRVTLSDIRNKPSLTDYVGRLLMRSDLQITDNSNAQETPDPGTVQTINYQAPVDCVATPSTTIGASCSLSTTADALVPGTVTEDRRSVWQLGQIEVRDAGPNGTGYASCPPVCGDGDETTFLRQGVFVP
jgi:hypothetical protein